MKNIFLTVLLSPMLLFAQQSSIDDMATFNDADSNRAHVTVSGKAFQLMARMEIDSTVDEAIQRLAKGIDGMEAYMEFTASTADNMLSKLEKSDTFEEYAAYTNKNEVFKFYMNETDGVVSEMLMVAKDDGKGYAASVFGNMDVRDIGKLYRIMNMRGFKYMNGRDEE
jgi:hypothetical protein